MPGQIIATTLVVSVLEVGAAADIMVFAIVAASIMVPTVVTKITFLGLSD